MKKWIFALTLSLPLSTAAFAEESINVTFAGSSTVMPVIESLHGVFESQGINVTVQGGGSSAGVRGLDSRMADVAMISREPTEAETQRFKVHTMAHDIVVIIVNSENKLNNTSVEEIRDIYSGGRLRWSDEQPIVVVTKESGRATKAVFEEKFDLTGKVRRDAVVIGSNGQAIATVAGDARAIGYVSYAGAHQAILQGARIKILSLNGVEADRSTAASGAYDLQRPLNLLYREEFGPEMASIVSAMSTEAGRALISRDFVLPAVR